MPPQGAALKPQHHVGDPPRHQHLAGRCRHVLGRQRDHSSPGRRIGERVSRRLAKLGDKTLSDDRLDQRNACQFPTGLFRRDNGVHQAGVAAFRRAQQGHAQSPSGTASRGVGK